MPNKNAHPSVSSVARAEREVRAGEEEQPDGRDDDRDEDVRVAAPGAHDRLDERREHDEQAGDERGVRRRRAFEARVLEPVADERDDAERERPRS